MNTLERLSAVAFFYGVTWQPEPGDLHHFLDRLDSLAGLRTGVGSKGHPCKGACICNHRLCQRRLNVGDRINHHEEKIFNPHYHFWLGDEG